MSVSGKRGVGIPVILLHDAEGGIITIEMKDGSIYRGMLEDAQDNMNLTMKDCLKTNTNGTTIKIDMAYVRGSQIHFIVLPNMLSKAPFFNRIKMWRKFKGHAVFGLGGLIGPRGQSAAIIQKSQSRRLLVTGAAGGGPGGQGGQGEGGGMPPPGANRGYGPPGQQNQGGQGQGGQYNNNQPPYQQQQQQYNPHQQNQQYNQGPPQYYGGGGGGGGYRY